MMCFAETSRCDGFPTCSDKSDEDNCTGMTFAVIYDSFKLSLPHIINHNSKLTIWSVEYRLYDKKKKR